MMSRLVRYFTAASLVIVGWFMWISRSAPAVATPVGLTYASPRPGAVMIRPETSLAVRATDTINPDSLAPDVFAVSGSFSGNHLGTVALADDGRTIVFQPTRPFALGELVTATLRPGLRTTSGAPVGGATFSFSTMARRNPSTASTALERAIAEAAAQSTPSQPIERTAATYTLPADFPVITTTVTDTLSPDLYVFIAPFVVTTTQSSDYVAILDGLGQPVYVQPSRAFDFKVQPNGWITYFSDIGNRFYAMDNTYTIVDSYEAGNGYPTDAHELKLLPNGHAVLMIYDDQVIDMSLIAPGGQPDATVTGLVLQELDTNDNVVFEWRSWDHFLITDTLVSLTDPVVDYVHGNAIEVDTDGDWLVSSRHLSEITKIDRETGDVVWRWGGVNNQITVTNESAPYFDFQHDIRRLANGHVSLFDNRTNLAPLYSRAVEYSLDEDLLTATRIWEYRNTPDTYGFAMGNTQRLASGNTMIGWGTGGLVTEVRPDGSKAFELDLEDAVWTYRAYRQAWQGHPTTSPTLVVHETGGQRILAYSWNGATEIASFRVYSGIGPSHSTVIDSPQRSGFETQTVLVNPEAGCYSYRVVPIDKAGQEMTESNDVTNCPYVHHLVWIGHP